MKLEIIKELNMEKYSWCSSAVLTELSDGKGALTSVTTDYDEDYHMVLKKLILRNCRKSEIK